MWASNGLLKDLSLILILFYFDGSALNQLGLIVTGISQKKKSIESLRVYKKLEKEKTTSIACQFWNNYHEKCNAWILWQFLTVMESLYIRWRRIPWWFIFSFSIAVFFHNSLKPSEDLIFLVLHNRLVCFKLIKISLASISENYTAVQVLPFFQNSKRSQVNLQPHTFYNNCVFEWHVHFTDGLENCMGPIFILFCVSKRWKECLNW